MADPRLRSGSFERLFNPDAEGTLTGMIGRASGVPFQAEREAQYQTQLQGQQGNALGELGRLLEETGDPQRAIVKFMQTPTGRASMASPKFPEMLAKFQEMATTPKYNLTPGGAVVDSQGKTIASQPTEAVQTFEGIAKAGNVSPADVSTAARGRIQPQNMQPQSYEVVFPDGSPGAITIDPTGARPPIVVRTKGQTQQPAGEPEPSSPGKIGMFRSTGANAAVRGTAAAIGETIDPTSQTGKSRELGQQSTEMDYFRTALQSLGDSSARLGVPKSVVDAINNLGGERGFFTAPPTQQLDRAMQLHGIIANNIALETQSLGSGTLDKKGIERANARIQAYQHVLGALPTLQEMRAEKKAITSGKVPETGMGGAIAEATNSIIGAVGGAKEAAGQAGKSAADVGGAVTGPAQPAKPAGDLPQYTPEDIAIGVKNIGGMNEAQLIQAGKNRVIMGHPELRAALLKRVQELKGARRK